MSQKEVLLDGESFSCSICLDLLKDPVTIPCGHSYCMKCIEHFWDEGGEKKLYICPQCRQSFTVRPVLVKNIMLVAVVEQLKVTELQATPVDCSFAGPEDVACDACTGRKRKAKKSCLTCLVSLCEKHLQLHYDVTRLRKHQLVEPSKKLHENICSHHDEPMKMFCRTDQQIICYVCTVEEHKGHDIISSAAERREKQKELKLRRQDIQQRIQNREEDVKLLQQETEAINVSADKTVEDSEGIISELIHLLQRRSCDLKQQVRSQQSTELSLVKELQEKLEQEIRELKRRDDELEQLSNTEDPNQFLHSFGSLSALSESSDSSRINSRPLSYFKGVTAAVSELRDWLKDTLRIEWTNLSLTVTHVDVLLSDKPTRADFLKHSQEITLDPNTAHSLMSLSEGNRKVTLCPQNQGHPDHPERFTLFYQILSEQSLNGLCYWEVTWTGKGGYVAVAYKDEETKQTSFRRSKKSWGLFCNGNNNSFHHDGHQISIPGCDFSRVGVFLDHRAGTLSFYRVSETMTLLHKVQTSFTQPLYAGIRLHFSYGDSARICKLK